MTSGLGDIRFEGDIMVKGTSWLGVTSGFINIISGENNMSEKICNFVQTTK